MGTIRCLIQRLPNACKCVSGGLTLLAEGHAVSLLLSPLLYILEKLQSITATTGIQRGLRLHTDCVLLAADVVEVVVGRASTTAAETAALAVRGRGCTSVVFHLVWQLCCPRTSRACVGPPSPLLQILKRCCCCCY